MGGFLTIYDPDSKSNRRVEDIFPVPSRIVISGVPISAENPVPTTPVSLPPGASTAAQQLPDNHQVLVSNNTDPATATKQTDGTQKTQIVTRSLPVSAQNPLPVDGDSVYAKDTVATLWDEGTFSGGNAWTIFNNLDDEVEDTSATNPKWFRFSLERPFRCGSVAIVSKTGNFSNVKVTFLDRQGTVIDTIDDSASATKYTSNRYDVADAHNVCCMLIEFYTADPVKIAFVYLRKTLTTRSVLSGTDDFGTVQNVRVTRDKTLLVTSTEYLTAVAEGDLPDHYIFRKIGATAPSAIGTTRVDLWPVGGTINVPSSAAKIKIKTVAVGDAVGGTGINYVKVEGLDANYASVSEVMATVGTADGGLSLESANLYLRVNSVREATDAEATAFAGIPSNGAGSTGAADGNIDVVDAATGLTVYRRISAGDNLCRCLLYTTAANEYLGITEIIPSAGAGGAQVKAEYITFTLRATCLPDGTAVEYFYPHIEIGVQNAAVPYRLGAPIWIPPMCDVKVSAKGDSAQGYTGSCVLAGWTETE